MGSAASTATSVIAAAPLAFSRKVHPPSTHKVPLHVAIASSITIQRYVRGYLAKKKLIKLRNKAKQTEQAATDYLNSMRMQRVKSDRHSEVGILRKSWMADGTDSPLRSFSMDSNGAAQTMASLVHLGVSRSEAQFSPQRRGSQETGLGSHLEEVYEDEDEKFHEQQLIYPSIGFVIKGKLENSGRKVFINLCHSSKLTRPAASELRLWTEERRVDEEGELIVEEVLVIDVVIPTDDFEDNFVFKEEEGLLPSSPAVRDRLANLCVLLLNNMDHCPDSFQPPAPGLRESEDYRISPHTHWPKIKRGYIGSLSALIHDPTDSALRLLAPVRLSREPPPISTQVIAALCPMEVRCWMALSLSCLSGTDSLSTIAKVGQADPQRKQKKFRDLDKVIEEELEAHQKQYVDQLRRIKEGFRVFVVLHYGLLFLYNGDSLDSPGDSSVLSMPYPYGKQELARLVMSSVQLETSWDLVNDLFFLHLDLVSEELDTLFLHSKFLNFFSTTALNPRRVTLQFRTFSELLTWKMVFEAHARYALYSLAKLPALAPALRFHSVSLLSMPSSKTVWLTEKVNARTRKRYFAKIDRGWFILFPNDSSVTPSLSNASEIFCLAEFYFRSNEGELDPETKAVITSLSNNITYAQSQYFRYFLPWLDDNDLLADFASTCVTASNSGTSAIGAPSAARGGVLNLVGCCVDFEIVVPEPQTSDDDSDFEADKEIDETIAGVNFRVLRPKPAPAGSRLMSSSTSSLSTRSTLFGSDGPGFSPRFLQVRDALQSEYNTFTKVLNLSRCLERPFPMARKRKEVSATLKKKASLDTSFFCLNSDDESEDSSSDRDYFDDTNPLGLKEEEDRIKTWMIQLVGNDGRIYRIKFGSAVEFDDWRRAILARCITPSTAPTTSSSGKNTPLKVPKSESFKGTHSFEFLKEHAVSSAESTSSASSTSSMLMGGSATAATNVTTSSLLSSMLSGAGKVLTSITRPDVVERPWEATIDTEATKKFARSLRVTEKVFASGVVLKHEKTVSNASAAAAPKQKRILLVTDAPRLVFIDTIGNIARGNMDLLADLKVEVKEADGGDFEVIIAGNPNRFSPADTSDKDSKFWVRVIRYAITRN
eukprot:scaffold1404_cov173-Ochromonas_danica.AAC.2